MSVDRIANMLSTIKNASMSKKHVVEVFYSKECEEIAKVLKARNFLKEVKVFKPEKKSFKMLHLELGHQDDIFAVSDIKRISKPGNRVYKTYSELHRVAAGFGLLIVSTSRGILSGEDAKKKKLGGEVICEVK